MMGAIENSPRRFVASLASASCLVLCGFAADLVFAFCELGLRMDVQVVSGVLVGFALLGTCAIPCLLLAAWLAPRVSAFVARALSASRGWATRSASVNALALAVVAPIYTLGSWWIARECMLEIVRPENAALAIALSHLAWACVTGLLYLGVRALLSLLAARLAERFPVSPRAILIGLAGAAVLAAAALAFRYRVLVLALPWKDIAHVAAILATALFSVWLYRGRRFSLAVLGAYAALWLAGLSAAFFIRPRDYLARDVFERELVTSSVLSSVYTHATDWDRDGHRGSIGGADCKPHNPRIHPGAAEIPGNKVDEDCDGRDLGDSGDELLKGRANYPLPPSVPTRMSIVLITIDAFAAAHLRSFGYPRDPAPELEKLIATGTLFENCFAQGPSTRLSIPSLLTSRYDSMIPQELIGRFPYPLDPRNLSVSEVLKGNGYHTIAVVPAAYFSKSKWRGLDQGFNVFDESVARGEPAFNAERVTDAAIMQLRRAPKTAPIFLWIHYFDPHSPHANPPDSRFPGTRREDIYDSELAHTDSHVGRLIAEAKQQLGQNTLFVVTGDHGYGFGGRRYARHGYGYDLNTITLHVPLIVSAPYVRHARVASLCSTIDLAPTLTNFARVTRPLPFQGFSLIPEIMRGEVTRPQIIFHQFFVPEKLLRGKEPLQKVAVRTPLYNYMLDRATATPSLFRWREDYAEEHDLIGEPGTAQVTNEMASALSQFTFATTKRSEVHIHPSMLAKPAEPVSAASAQDD